MSIGHMKTNDFPWNAKKSKFLIAIYLPQAQLECWINVVYQKYDNFLILPTTNGNQIISNFSVMYYICFALPSLSIKIDACSGRLNQ